MNTDDSTSEIEETEVDHQELFNEFKKNLTALGYEFDWEDGSWTVYPPSDENEY